MDKNINSNLINYLNNVLQNNQLHLFKWIPYFHNYNSTTEIHDGEIIELVTPIFETYKQILPYLHALQENNITLTLGHVKKGQGLRIWIPVKQLDQEINNQLNRSIACLMGLAIGDAMGVTQERFPNGSFEQTVEMVKNQRLILKKNPQISFLGDGPWKNNGVTLQPGDFTDDTSMALCLADSLLFRKSLDPHDLMLRYIKWWEEGYNASVRTFQNGQWKGQSVGLGGNINKAMIRFKNDPTNPIVGGTNPKTDAGNGAIMCMAPVPIYWHENKFKAMQMAQLQASVTHNVSETKEASALMAYIICCGIKGQSKSQIFDSIKNLETQFKNPEINQLVIQNAPWKNKSDDQIITLPGRTLWSLEAALWCIYHTDSFQDSIIKAVNLGGDADTVAAITGQIAGAIYGLNQIPQQWLDQLKHNTKIKGKAHALFFKFPLAQNLMI